MATIKATQTTVLLKMFCVLMLTSMHFLTQVNAKKHAVIRFVVNVAMLTAILKTISQNLLDIFVRIEII
jgi:hypothetical protein